jgi:predicted MFS family arabinose efflux permease
VRLTGAPRYRWVVATTAFFAVFAAIGLGRFGYSAVLPAMQEALGLTSAQAGSLASWNQAGYTVMALVGGMLASRFGPRAVVTAGLAVTALGMFLTGISNGLAAASAARLLTGMGNGMVLAPCIAVMAAWFHERRHGVATGIVPAGSSFALVVVGPIVPALIANGGEEGWRLAWYLFAAATTAMTVITYIAMRDRPREAPAGPRSVLPAGRAAAAAAAAAQAAPPPPSPPASRRSMRLDIRGISRSRHAWHLGLTYFLYGFAFLMFFTFFQKRLISDLDYSSHAAGILFLLVGISGTLAGVFWGGVSDRVGRGPTIAVTFALQALCALVFALWPSVAALVFASWVFGFCALSMPSLMGAACADRYGVRLASASLGFVTVFLGIGQATGPYVGGALEDAFSSLAPTYLLAAGVFTLGAIVAAFLPRPASIRAGHGSGQP